MSPVEVFTPSPHEIAYDKGLMEAMDEARKKGSAAVTYKGDMVDEAMLKTARAMLEFGKSLGLQF